MGDDKVVYKGFLSIEEAHAAWDEYCMKRTLPLGLAVPGKSNHTSAYRGSPSQQVANSRAPQHIPAVSRAYHSTARTPPPPYLSQNAAVRAHGHGSVSPSHQFDTASRANAVGGAPLSHPVHQRAVNTPILTNNFAVRSRNFGSALSTNFYAVLTGLAPGVYDTR